MEAGFETLFAHEKLSSISGQGNPQRYLAGILPMVARVVVWPTSEHQPADPGPYPRRNLFWVHMCDIRDKDRDVTIYFLVLELFRYRRHRPSHSRLRQLFRPAAADAFKRGPQQKQHSGPSPNAEGSPPGPVVLCKTARNLREALRSEVWLARRVCRTWIYEDGEEWRSAEFVDTLILLG